MYLIPVYGVPSLCSDILYVCMYPNMVHIYIDGYAALLGGVTLLYSIRSSHFALL